MAFGTFSLLDWFYFRPRVVFILGLIFFGLNWFFIFMFFLVFFGVSVFFNYQQNAKDVTLPRSLHLRDC